MYDNKEMKWLLKNNGWKLYRRKDSDEFFAQDPVLSLRDDSGLLPIKEAYVAQFFRILKQWKPDSPIPEEWLKGQAI